MKRIMLAAALALAAGAVAAQERPAPPPPPESDEGRALQERLKERARRIPARGLAAALRAARDGRSERARTLPGAPDLAALRAALDRTEREDAAGQRSLADMLARGPDAQRVPAPGLRVLDPAQLQTVARAEIDRVRLPVLIPAVSELRETVKVYGLENAYTATARIDAETLLSISGTCHRVIGGDPDIVAFRRRLAENPPRLPGTGSPYSISRNPLGVDISFSKFGCGYVMTVECPDPDNDPRCAGDDYVVGLADSMILINPALAGGE